MDRGLFLTSIFQRTVALYLSLSSLCIICSAPKATEKSVFCTGTWLYRYQDFQTLEETWAEAFSHQFWGGGNGDNKATQTNQRCPRGGRRARKCNGEDRQYVTIHEVTTHQRSVNKAFAESWRKDVSE